jgi:hypothetical protein
MGYQWQQENLSSPIHIPPSIITVSIPTGTIAAVETRLIFMAIADNMPYTTRTHRQQVRG